MVNARLKDGKMGITVCIWSIRMEILHECLCVRNILPEPYIKNGMGGDIMMVMRMTAWFDPGTERVTHRQTGSCSPCPALHPTRISFLPNTPYLSFRVTEPPQVKKTDKNYYHHNNDHHSCWSWTQNMLPLSLLLLLPPSPPPSPSPTTVLQLQLRMFAEDL